MDIHGTPIYVNVVKKLIFFLSNKNCQQFTMEDLLSLNVSTKLDAYFC